MTHENASIKNGNRIQCRQISPDYSWSGKMEHIICERFIEMDTPINLKFTPEKKQYIRATRALAIKSPGFLVLAIVLALGMIGSVIVLILGKPEGVLPYAPMVIMIGLFYLLYFFVIIPWQFSRSYKSNPYLKMERSFTISDENLLMAVGDKSNEFQWENFQKVIDGGDFYLMIYKAQNRIYPFIPKDAFASQADHEAFLQHLAEKSIPVK
jgi:hypothetical protein